MYVQDVPAVYDLYAVSNHFGGLGGGHYNAFAKQPGTETWYCFDDSSVREVTEEQVCKASAYVLFYRRRAEAQADTGRAALRVTPQSACCHALALRHDLSVWGGRQLQPTGCTPFLTASPPWHCVALPDKLPPCCAAGFLDSAVKLSPEPVAEVGGNENDAAWANGGWDNRLGGDWDGPDTQSKAQWLPNSFSSSSAGAGLAGGLQVTWPVLKAPQLLMHSSLGFLHTPSNMMTSPLCLAVLQAGSLLVVAGKRCWLCPSRLPSAAPADICLELTATPWPAGQRRPDGGGERHRAQLRQRRHQQQGHAGRRCC